MIFIKEKIMIGMIDLKEIMIKRKFSKRKEIEMVLMLVLINQKCKLNMK